MITMEEEEFFEEQQVSLYPVISYYWPETSFCLV